MHVERINAFPALRHEWNRLLRSIDGASVFQTYAWVANWWKHFGDDKELYLLVARDNGTVTGIAPLMIDPVRVRGLRACRVLRFIGHGITDYLDFLLAPGREEEVLRAFSAYMRHSGKGWGLGILGEIPVTSRTHAGLQAALNEAGIACVTEEDSPCPYLTLPDDGKRFLSSLSANCRNNIKRKAKKLGRLGELEYRVVTDDQATALEQFFALQGIRRTEPLSEAAKQFHRDVSVDLSDSLSLELLSLDGKDLCALYNYDYGGVRYY